MTKSKGFKGIIIPAVGFGILGLLSGNACAQYKDGDVQKILNKYPELIDEIEYSSGVPSIRPIKAVLNSTLGSSIFYSPENSSGQNKINGMGIEAGADAFAVIDSSGAILGKMKFLKNLNFYLSGNLDAKYSQESMSAKNDGKIASINGLDNELSLFAGIYNKYYGGLGGILEYNAYGADVSGLKINHNKTASGIGINAGYRNEKNLEFDILCALKSGAIADTINNYTNKEGFNGSELRAKLKYLAKIKGKTLDTEACFSQEKYDKNGENTNTAYGISFYTPVNKKKNAAVGFGIENLTTSRPGYSKSNLKINLGFKYSPRKIWLRK